MFHTHMHILPKPRLSEVVGIFCADRNIQHLFIQAVFWCLLFSGLCSNVNCKSEVPIAQSRMCLLEWFFFWYKPENIVGKIYPCFVYVVHRYRGSPFKDGVEIDILMAFVSMFAFSFPWGHLFFMDCTCHSLFCSLRPRSMFFPYIFVLFFILML